MDHEGALPHFYLGLDLGGTNIKGGVVDDEGRDHSSVMLPTYADRGPEAGIETLVDVARQAVEDSGIGWEKIAAIGLGSAGTLDVAHGRIVNASNLPLWNGFAIGPRLAERLDRPTILLNDANAAAFGEFWAGAGRTMESLVLLTIGTGIGCGIVESGRIVEGRHGMGGECGHMTIQMDGGRPCSCGRSGHLEAYASVTALLTRAVEEFATQPDSLLGPSLRAGTLSAAEIFERAWQGDALALRLVRETARYLAVGASIVMQTVDPEIVLFGGGLTLAGSQFLKLIVDEIANLVLPGFQTRIEFASLGSPAGFIGAAGWARQTRNPSGKN